MKDWNSDPARNMERSLGRSIRKDAEFGMHNTIDHLLLEPIAERRTVFFRFTLAV